MEFEWDEAKRRANLAKHRIDFVDAKEIWRGDVLEIRSSQDITASPATLPTVWRAAGSSRSSSPDAARGYG
jgi:hypothetical protein